MGTYLWALYAREVKRFQKIWIDTVFSPIVSIALYLGVFGIVSAGRTIDGLPYVTFVYVGLLAMQVVNSSFSNPAFAFVIAKNVGNIIDLQIVPIKAWGVGIAYALAALTRSVVTLAIALLATAWFIPGLSIEHPLYTIVGIVITGIQFGMFGVVVGCYAKNFETLTFITTFIMQPMIFLAGVFYPVSTLPRPWSVISLFNPIHHNVNLIRYGVTGYSDVSPLISFGFVAAVSVALFVIMNFATKKCIKMQ